MIRIEIKLQDGRTIPALIRERYYRKLTAKIERMSFIEKLKVLFIIRRK